MFKLSKLITSSLKNHGRALRNTFHDFAEHSTIHGVAYVGEPNRPRIERTFWIIGFCLSIVCCGKLIYEVWNLSPIIISFSESPTPIWQLPFPSIMICPMILAQTSKFNITDLLNRVYNRNLHFDRLSDIERKRILAVNLFCSALSNLDFGDYVNCNECSDTMQNIRIPPEDLFVECKFQNKLINCTAAFREIPMAYNLCYIFNALEHHPTDEDLTTNWNIDDGYGATTAVETYPRRALGPSKKSSLSILLKVNAEDVANTCHSRSGFYVEFQAPHEIPRLTTEVFPTSLGESSTFVLKPKVLTTSKTLRDYSIAQRGCYFHDENPLRFFKQYTQHHCQLDCLVNLLLKNCGCTLFSMSKYSPRPNICGPHQIGCLFETEKKLFEQDFTPCGCLPACSSITFETEIITVHKYNISSASRRDHRTESRYTELSFFFKDSQFMTSRRTELYGTTTYLANCGGIMGLCLGVSVISLLEIVYYCTVRFWCSSHRLSHTQLTIFDQLKYAQDRRKRLKTALSGLMADYSRRTTIQGIKFVADASLTWLEQIWWASVVLVSLFFCGSLVFQTFDRYDKTPMIISFANEETSIAKIPFPTVTMCPQVVSLDMLEWYDTFKVYNRSLYELQDSQVLSITAMTQVCDPDLFSDIDPDNKTNCDECFEDLEYMMGSISFSFQECHHLMSDTCETMFNQVLTEEGICYTYNGLNVYRDNGTSSMAYNWTLDNGYQVTLDTYADAKPRTGTSMMLHLNLRSWKSLNDGLCKGPVKGFKVYFHLPNETPQISQHYFLVPYDRVVLILITPNMIEAAPELHAIPVAKRQCFFDDERYLRFFRYYTQNNCEIECLANMTVSKCGCQRMHMPGIIGVKNCGISDIKCYQSVIQQSVELAINQDIASVCNCLPTCNVLSYDAEVHQLAFTDYSGQSGYDQSDRFFHSILNVVFRENKFVSLRRSQLFSTTELIANCGGLLSLFLGFSLLSIWELLYFCVFRLIKVVLNTVKQ